MRDNWLQFKNLFGILWYWGSFPLSFVTYTAIISFVVGIIVAHFA
jgi:hypothetical protein